MASKRYLVTSALPYANGPLHFGHLAGVYLPADIFCRHKRMLGERVIHICGSDEHGVAIMLSAEKEKTDYQSYVDRWHTAHHALFGKFGIEFDFFGRTSSDYHRDEVIRWFKELNKNGYIGKKLEKQLYCNSCSRFLPDRYVEGVCYVCNHDPARGDECPNCGEWIDALRLKSPRCKVCGSKDLGVRESEHWYLLLTKLEEKFRPWFGTKSHWRPHVYGYVNSLLQESMVDRAITRDLSWGIDVPVEGAQGKKLYVWFDAPIGYVSNTKEWLKQTGSREDYLRDWWQNPDAEILHFIGKDNIIFHALIWPSMALGTGFVRPPTNVPASHFLNLEGKQFSKSTGWYVDAEKAIEAFGQDALRYYLATLIPETGDSSFSWAQFETVHGELANKVGNFINRSCSFLAKHWPDGISKAAFERALQAPEVKQIDEKRAEAVGALNGIEFARAISALIRLAEIANETFHVQEPWKTIKTDRERAETTLALSMLFTAAMAACFRPFLPDFCARLSQYFGAAASDESWDRIYRGEPGALGELFADGYRVPVEVKPLLPRLDPDKLKEFRLV